jgi:hypothetical protein
MVLHGQGRHEPKGTIHASPLPPSPLPTTTAVILPLPFPRLTPRAHVFVDGCVQNIPIKEGEMFMLPAHTPHSPQRFADTVSETERRWPPLSYALQVGIVMERKRLPVRPTTCGGTATNAAPLFMKRVSSAQTWAANSK